MYQLLRPILFKFDPEKVHNYTLGLMRLVGALAPLRGFVRQLFAPQATKPVQAFGLTFKNKIGLAAGYDKDGLAWRGLACLGFGHIEIGTITPLPQEGNPKPRIFRLPEDHAIINRMGFPGRGAQFVLRQLQGGKPRGLILGVNIGKGKETSIENAALNYVTLINTFAPIADYLAINISSPNTIGLRRLQNRDHLNSLLADIVIARDQKSKDLDKNIPLLVKISPDLTDQELEDALEAILGSGVDGIIATNTTTARGNLISSERNQQGGLSGKPLTSSSTEIIKKIHLRSQGRLPIIAAGGIMSANEAKEKLEAGAILVQIFSGLVFRGPRLIREIAE
ncbi:MAG: quinone-dependent dihydroorotate dehydrogenase [Chloroflexi bacterium]|nr:quinone-dependent dihydroorotate dehydrogenase [Chloroflexota bacterium]